MFNLFNERKESMAVVEKDGHHFNFKGLEGTQISHIKRENLTEDQYYELKSSLDLYCYSELGQLTLDELL